ncbi:hypothetical protein [Streptomyces sp. SudanB91_2054]|uniref:hypothetical protein n=1 Tax=Streptomyces sp. SudanB91_2054 TaxID=3035278 RepID=UPI0036DC85CD
MGIADTSIAAAAAALSGAAAFASWRASREANATAASVAQIERDRWHNALTPQLRMRQQPDGLEVQYEGPASLGRLQIQLQVRDDRDRSNDPELAGSVTREMRAEVIWGPRRFRPGIDGADEQGRTVGPFFLEPSDVTRLATDPSVRPSWYEGVDGEQRWRQQYRDGRMRLWATCTAEGHKPWRLSFVVPGGGHWGRTGPIAQV